MTCESFMRKTTPKFRGFGATMSGKGNHTRLHMLVPDLGCHFSFPPHVRNGQPTLSRLIIGSECYISNPHIALPVNGCLRIVSGGDGISYE